MLSTRSALQHRRDIDRASCNPWRNQPHPKAFPFRRERNPGTLICISLRLRQTTTGRSPTMALWMQRRSRRSSASRRPAAGCSSLPGASCPTSRRCFRSSKLFDRVVAENGALLYDPATDKERAIADAPPAALVERLQECNVTPLSVGRSIVATWEPNETTVLEVIRDLGLELQIIFNKGAVMVLPPGVNKATGLAAALRELELSHHNVVAVGDAENDHAFLRRLRLRRRRRQRAADGEGNRRHPARRRPRRRRDRTDRAHLPRRCAHRAAAAARHPARHRERPRSCISNRIAASVLIAGKSGIGKSTLATALTERMAERQFEFCVFDPEGDYDELENAVSTGDAKSPPHGAGGAQAAAQAGDERRHRHPEPESGESGRPFSPSCCRRSRHCAREQGGRTGC